MDQIVDRLEAMINRFDPETCIDYAYETVEELESLLQDILREDEVDTYDAAIIDSIVDNFKKAGIEYDKDEVNQARLTNMMNDDDPLGSFVESLLQAIEDDGFTELDDDDTNMFGNAPARLTDDELEGQYRWNTTFNQLHTDSVEGEDLYSMCVGYLLAMGYTPDNAHRIASHGGTNL